MFQQNIVSSKLFETVNLENAQKQARAIAQGAVWFKGAFDEEQHDYLQSIFAPRPVYYECKLSGSGHPVIAALTEYAQRESNNYRGATTIEIGAGVTRKEVWSNAHLCWDHGEIRDNARHQNNLTKLRAFSDPNAIALWHDMDAASIRPHVCEGGRVCYAGINNCTAKGSTIVSINSAYRIPHEDWPQIFERTGARKAVIWMLLPEELVDNRKKAGRYYNYETAGGRSYFWFPGDTSVGYVHETNNWRKYLTYTTERGPTGSAYFEIVGWWGPMAKILVNYVSGYGEIVRTLIPINKNYVAVPDVVDWVHNARRDAARDILAERQHVEAVYSYAMRQAGNAFEQRNVLSFAVGRTFHLRVGNVVRIQSWKVDHRDLVEIVSRICHIATVHRDESNQTMAYVCERLRANRFRSLLPSLLKLLDVGARMGATLLGMVLWRRDILAATLGSFAVWRILSRLIRRLAPRRPLRRADLMGDDPYSANYFDRSENSIVTCVGTKAADADRCNYLRPDWHPFRSIFLTPPVGNKKKQETGKDGAQSASEEPEQRLPMVSWPDPTTIAGCRNYASDFVLAMHRSNIPAARSNGDILSNILSDTAVRDDMEFIALIGGPGTGKSHSLRPSTKDERVVVVSPMRALADDFVKKGFEAYTVDVGMRHALLADTVVIDEAFLVHASHAAVYILYGKCRKLILLGDPRQINFIDFDDAFETRDNCGVFLPLCKIVQKNTTYRCPQDITKVLNANFDYALECCSDVKKSVLFGPPTEKVDQILVFTQAAKTAIRGSDTVHAMQGRTFKSVHLVVTPESISLLNASPSHFVVGISRHTDKLYVDYQISEIDKTQLECRFLLTPAYMHTLESFCQTILTDRPFVPDDQVRAVDEGNTPPEPCPLKGPDAIDDILCSVALGSEAEFEPVIYGFRQPGGVLALHTPIELPPEAAEYRMRGKLFDHNTRPNQRHMMIRTMIDRYSTATSQMNPDQVEKTAQALFDAYKETYIKEFVHISPDLIEQGYIDNIIAQFRKGTCNRVKDIGIEDDISLVTFFLKAQSKVKTGADIMEMAVPGSVKGKVGQGVSAWSKTLNAITGGYIRACSAALRSSVLENVNFVGGMNEKLDLVCATNIDTSKVYALESDLSEFDSMQNLVTIRFECMVFEALGAPMWFVMLYWHMRSKWHMKAIGFASMDVVGKKPSGEPATLYNNSNTCAAIIAYVYDIRGALVFFKGDDFAAFSNEEIVTRKENLKCLEINLPNLGIKAQSDRPLQFVNYFITGMGPVPDLVRLAAKIKSKPLKVVMNGLRQNRWVRVVNSMNNQHPTTAPDKINTVPIILQNGEIAPYELAKFLYSTDKMVVHLNVHRPVKNPGLFYYFAALSGKVLVIHSYDEAFTLALFEFRNSVKDRVRFIDSVEKLQAAFQTAAEYYNLPMNCIEAVYNWICTFSTIPSHHAKNYYDKILYRDAPVELPEQEYIQKPDRGLTVLRHHDCGTNGWDCFYRVVDYLKVKSMYAERIFKELGSGAMVDFYTALKVAVEMHVPLSIYVGNAGTEGKGVSDNFVAIHGEGSYRLLLHGMHWTAVVPQGELTYEAVFNAIPSSDLVIPESTPECDDNDFIRMRDGDVFRVFKPGTVLAHCIGADATMGAGIAKTINRDFDSRKGLKGAQLVPGTFALQDLEDGRLIAHLVTKPYSAIPPADDVALEKAIISLAHYMYRYSLKELIMPRIATGLDKRSWRDVYAILYKHFVGTGIIIRVFRN